MGRLTPPSPDAWIVVVLLALGLILGTISATAGPELIELFIP